MTTLHARNTTAFAGSTGTFNKDLDVGEGTSVIEQQCENAETFYMYAEVGGKTIPSGTWSYRIWLGRGSGGGANPDCNVKLVILDNTDAIRDTIIDDFHDVDDNTPTLKTGSAGGVAEKTIASDERVALVVDTVVAGARVCFIVKGFPIKLCSECAAILKGLIKD